MTTTDNGIGRASGHVASAQTDLLIARVWRLFLGADLDDFKRHQRIVLLDADKLKRSQSVNAVSVTIQISFAPRAPATARMLGRGPELNLRLPSKFTPSRRGETSFSRFRRAGSFDAAFSDQGRAIGGSRRDA